MNEEMWTYSTTRNWLKQKQNINYHQKVNWCNGTLHKRSKFESYNFFTFKCISYKSRGLICDVYCPTTLSKFHSCWLKCVCQYKQNVKKGSRSIHATYSLLYPRHRRYLPSTPGHCNYILAHALLTELKRMFSLNQCVDRDFWEPKAISN